MRTEAQVCASAIEKKKATHSIKKKQCIFEKTSNFVEPRDLKMVHERPRAQLINSWRERGVRARLLTCNLNDGVCKITYCYRGYTTHISFLEMGENRYFATNESQKRTRSRRQGLALKNRLILFIFSKMAKKQAHLRVICC